MSQKPEEFPLHISVSNQSMALQTVDIEVKLDGSQVFKRELRTGTQHNWEQLTVNVAAGAHAVEVLETRTGAARQHQFNVKGETNLIITFQSPPPQVDVTEAGGQVGFI